MLVAESATRVRPASTACPKVIHKDMLQRRGDDSSARMTSWNGGTVSAGRARAGRWRGYIVARPPGGLRSRLLPLSEDKLGFRMLLHWERLAAPRIGASEAGS